MANQQESTLQSVAHERLFVVPDYQRPYAWEQKQLEDLWQDLDLLGKGRHYAGTLVLRQHPGQQVETSLGTTLSVWDVVDGQQRLTTCFLLLDRIRRRLMTAGAEGAAEIVHMIGTTYGMVTVGGVKRPKLRLGSDLNDFWQGTILGNEPAATASLVAGHRRLRYAADFFDAKLDALTEDVAPAVSLKRLTTLLSRTTSGLRFLVYEVGSEAEVGVIFETLNERGRPLSELEKIKNYLLYLARQLPDERGDDLAATINKTWSSIFKHLATVPGAVEDTVLRAHWLATVNPDSRKWARTASLKVRFPRSRYVPQAERLIGSRPEDLPKEDDWELLINEVKDYVQGLERCALFASEIYNPSAAFVDFKQGKHRASSAHAGLRHTRVVALFFPVLFAARLRHPNDGDFYADMVRLCETYAARVFIIAQRRTNAGEPYINQLARRISDGMDRHHAKTRLATLAWEYADDHRVRAALAISENWYERRGHKYFLYEYERSLVSSPEHVPDYSMFTDTRASRTTEHILPRNPAAGSAWWDDFTTHDHETLRHTLGNLMLTFDNSSYSNKTFDKKRGTPTSSSKCYWTAQLAQEREVAQKYENWTPETIRARQQHLTSWALSRWSVDVPPPGEVRSVEDEIPDFTVDDIPEFSLDDNGGLPSDEGDPAP